MDLFGISSLILSLSSIIFSLFIYQSDRTSKINRSWFYFSISFSIWSFCLYSVTSTADYNTAFFWQFILDIAAIFLPTLYLNFIATLLKINTLSVRYALFGAAIFFSFFSLTPLFKTGMTMLYGEFFWIQPGPFYIVFPTYFGLLAAVSLVLLVNAYFKEKNDPLYRSQIRNTFIAGFFGSIGGISNFFPQLFDVYPYGNYLIVFYIVFMVYGVLRYKLLSTKVISAQLFSVALLLTLLFNLLSTTNPSEWILNFIILVIVSFFSFFLITSVEREVKTREKAELLTIDLEAANERLKELDQQKSEFVSLASHQLRAPLTAIKGYGSMLMEGDFGEISGGVRDAIDKIYQSTQSLVTIVADYLDVSRIDQGRMQYDFTNFDLKDLVAQVIEEISPNVDKTRLSLDFKPEPADNYNINADRNKIKQVIGNLIDNSIKYTPKGTIHVTIKKEDDKKMLIEIADTGVGIKPDVLPRLFERFTRAPDAAKTNILGTGLGLYVARKMVEAHHGRVWAESKGQNMGSQFYIELGA